MAGASPVVAAASALTSRRPRSGQRSMATARRVVMTGAAGLVGRAVTPRLPREWDLVLTDLHSKDDVQALDVTDIKACREMFALADAVVHLAAVPDPNASWSQLLPANVVGAYNVAQAAMDVAAP